MFSWIQSIAESIVSVIVVVFAFLGGGDPAQNVATVPTEVPINPPQEEIQATTTDDSIPTQEVEKARLESETAKAKADAERYRLEAERLKQEAEINKQTQVRSEESSPKTTTLPSGAIIDENGNILNQAELDKNTQDTLIEQQRRKQIAQEAEESARLNQQISEARIQVQNEERLLQQKNFLLSEYNTKKLNLEKKIVDRKSQYYSDYDALTESFRGRGVTASGVQIQYNNLLNEANKDIELLGIALENLRIEYLNRINAVQ